MQQNRDSGHRYERLRSSPLSHDESQLETDPIVAQGQREITTRRKKSSTNSVRPKSKKDRKKRDSNGEDNASGKISSSQGDEDSLVSFAFMTYEEEVALRRISEMGCFSRFREKLMLWYKNPEYTHVEAVDVSSGLSYSARQYLGVTRMKRSYTGTTYLFAQIYVHPNLKKRFFAILEDKHYEKADFNYVGMMCNFLFPFRCIYYRNRGDSYFCSELITYALIESGIFSKYFVEANNIIPEKTDPDALQKLISKFGKSVGKSEIVKLESV